MKDTFKWADGGQVRAAIDKKKLEVLGEAPAATDGKKKKAKAPVVEKAKTEEKKEEEEPTIDIT
jgi:hypothetical protein